MNATDNRVLIVDDETVILDILKEHLGSKGFECAIANSASEALTRLRAVDTALLLTDIVMPQTSGIELAQSARKITPEIAIIVMTGKSDTATAISAIRAERFGSYSRARTVPGTPSFSRRKSTIR